jgi:putative oxidoreductase
MAWITPYFPSGMAGLGLVVLRLAVVRWLLVLGFSGPLPIWQQAIAACLALAIAVGLWSRLFSVVVLGLVVIMVLFFSMMPLAVLPLLLVALALALIGPGAFSLDARQFGRRTLVLHDTSGTSRS